MTQEKLATISSEEESVGHLPLKRQIFWLLPVSLASVGVCVLLLKNQAWGADAAAIISVPINVAAIVVTILVDRGIFKNSAFRRPEDGSNRMKIAAYFTAGTLVLSGFFWYVQKEPDPFDYMSGDIRIGYNALQYQGWHTDSGGHSGFDVQVANHIMVHFKKKAKRIHWVNLGTLDNRIHALRGKWRATESGVSQEPVHLVISNFSMDSERAELIDFAGPYFVDAQGFLKRSEIKDVTDIPPGRVCVAEGSRGHEKLDQMGWNPVVRESLPLCVNMFRDNAVDAVSDDRSLLAGYAKAAAIKPPIKYQFGQEKIAVGMPNNMPRLCAEVSKALTDFLAYSWQNNFDTTLGALGLTGARAPQAVDPCQSAAPWLGR